MKIILDIDNKLLARAEDIAGITSKSELIRKALKALLERESARKLAKLSSSQPRLQPIPQRRFDSYSD